MNKEKTAKIFFLTSIILLVICVAFPIYFYPDYLKVRHYKDKICPNIYLDSYKISNTDQKYLYKKLVAYEDDILDSTIILKMGNIEYSYTLRELKIDVDKIKVMENLLNEKKSITYQEELKKVIGKKPVYNYFLKYDEEYLRKLLEEIKTKFNNEGACNGLIMDKERNLAYREDVSCYKIDVDKSLEILTNDITNMNSNEMVVELIGEELTGKRVENVDLIDTKVSSFYTNFDTTIPRAKNLQNALNYINGTVVKPGEIFSFHDHAGPYDKEGYVFYYEFVGNGVCQIATTTYNAALLGGLEIILRYPHAKKSVYIEGGLDATVASYDDGWNADMQFKNTYAYPLYISAYIINDEAHVDIWSNGNAKAGKTYRTESVQIGPSTYLSYLHIYESGREVDKKLIAKTFYPEI